MHGKYIGREIRKKIRLRNPPKLAYEEVDRPFFLSWRELISISMNFPPRFSELPTLHRSAQTSPEVEFGKKAFFMTFSHTYISLSLEHSRRIRIDFKNWKKEPIAEEMKPDICSRKPKKFGLFFLLLGERRSNFRGDASLLFLSLSYTPWLARSRR